MIIRNAEIKDIKSIVDININDWKENIANEFCIKCGGKKIDTYYFKLNGNEYEENLYLFNLK